MIDVLPRRTVLIALVGYAVLLLPPLRHLLESRMGLQMLVQIPLLVVIGYLLRGGIPRRVVAVIDRWNGQGITGLLLASLAGLFWMLPRSLDAAVGEASMEVAKFISVPLLIGLPMGLSWPRAGFKSSGRRPPGPGACACISGARPTEGCPRGRSTRAWRRPIAASGAEACFRGPWRRKRRLAGGA